jgi:hypothetical protein
MVKQSHITPIERQGESKYSFYSFTTLALDGVEWSASRPTRDFPPGNGPRYPLDRRLISYKYHIKILLENFNKKVGRNVFLNSLLGMRVYTKIVMTVGYG